MRPPAAAVRLLERWIPEAEREFLIGDLEERFHDEGLQARGHRAAAWWYWRQTLAALIALRPSRTRDPRPQTPRGDGPMRILWQDIRYGLRMLGRTPGFTAVAVITLALGIGANTAIFSVVNPILFQSLPYPGADRIVMVWERDRDGGHSNTTYATFRDIARDTRTLERAALMSQWTPTIVGGGDPEQLAGQSVSWSYFDVLGVRPMLGRTFDATEDAVGRNHEVMLSHGLWRRRFGSDPGIVGRSIRLGATEYQVIGVMAADFENLLSPNAQLWRPLGYDETLPWACRTCRHLRLVARVRSDVTVAAAGRELEVIATNLARAYPGDFPAPGVDLVPLHEQLARSVRPALLAILGAVGFVLLIACANVMSLMLARANQRQTEFAIRAALGAGHRRVVRQLLTESLLLSLIGAAAGLLVAHFGLDALLAIGPRLPRLQAIRLDGRVLAFTLGVAVLAGVLFGIAPALAATRSDLHGQLKQDGRRAGRGPRLSRGALVIGEVALAVMLLVGAGLLLRSLGRLFDVRPGFATAHLLTMEVQAAGPRFANDTTVRAFYDQALEAIRAVPGVRAAEAVSQLPLGGNFDGFGVHLEDKPSANPELDPSADRYAVSAGYVEAMGIPVRRGRAFTAADRINAPAVALINETFAARAWPGDDPIGKRVRIGGVADGPWRTIVGIVGDVHHVSLEAPQSNQVYVPAVQWGWADNPMVLVVRTRDEPTALAAAIRQAIWSVDRDQPISKVASMERIVADSAASRRFALVLFEAFALVALLLAAAGIYGMLAGHVSERTREIGIRSALGASRSGILGLILRQGLSLTLTGVAIGTAGAMALSRFIESMLFGVAARDPVTFGGVAVVLLAVALAACAVPAWRAARLDPMIALRSE